MLVKNSPSMVGECPEVELDYEVGGIPLSDQGVVTVKASCLGADCGILGMNIIADCWTQVFQGTHPVEMVFRSTNSPRAGAAWTQAFAACRQTLMSAPGPCLQGVAKLEPQLPVVHTPDMEVMLWAQVPQGGGAASPTAVSRAERSGEEARAVSERIRKRELICCPLL
ncbi:hypothetical protein SRHO_G00193450 [Serrasalmus rhombeus]